jgi:hypothetical protein
MSAIPEYDPHTTLVHIVDWPQFLGYVRSDKSYSSRWRPAKVDFSVAETLDKIEDLTAAERGAYLTLVLEYACCPLADPNKGLASPRQMSYKRAARSMQTGNTRVARIFERLEQTGCISLVPPVSGTEMRGVEERRIERSGDEKSRDEGSGVEAQVHLGSVGGQAEVLVPRLDCDPPLTDPAPNGSRPSAAIKTKINQGTPEW